MAAMTVVDFAYFMIYLPFERRPRGVWARATIACAFFVGPSMLIDTHFVTRRKPGSTGPPRSTASHHRNPGESRDPPDRIVIAEEWLFVLPSLARCPQRRRVPARTGRSRAAPS